MGGGIPRSLLDDQDRVAGLTAAYAKRLAVTFKLSRVQKVFVRGDCRPGHFGIRDPSILFYIFPSLCHRQFFVEDNALAVFPGDGHPLQIARREIADPAADIPYGVARLVDSASMIFP